MKTRFQRKMYDAVRGASWGIGSHSKPFTSRYFFHRREQCEDRTIGQPTFHKKSRRTCRVFEKKGHCCESSQTA